MLTVLGEVARVRDDGEVSVFCVGLGSLMIYKAEEGGIYIYINLSDTSIDR